MTKKLLFIAFIAMLTLSAKAKSKADTLIVTTNPQMHCSSCENKIKQNIRFVKGCKKIETSVAEQKIILIYDGKKAKYEDFETAFKKIGYEIKVKSRK